MQNQAATVVVLGTGGTIAGRSANASDNVGYTAGQVGVTQLLQAVPALAGAPLESEQVAQLDSKDMTHAVWRDLAARCAHHLARAEVSGVVVTHGTDTLEETAWFLQRVLAPAKPLVMTAAMRPATALQADGPQNLLDAVAVARHAGARGVVAVLDGRVHGARDVRKVHPYRIDAFDSGDAGAIAAIEEGRLRCFRPWPEGAALGLERVPADGSAWPVVEIVTSHAGARGAAVQALCDSGAHGLVVACTGNGTVHRELEAALVTAQERGVRVLRSTRTRAGRVIGVAGDALPSAEDLTPEKARVELMLSLLSRP
ncbi:asparaginase [Piscinibacter sp. XHJ-5]|uniref:asparaginase n=1 Tax=Piscinibacter sp. XHJ-5 TaxID=3037797 RepID=UPI002452CC88|nr:asparaginase [Piscinibacter sp. XHJ-5]